MFIIIDSFSLFVFILVVVFFFFMFLYNNYINFFKNYIGFLFNKYIYKISIRNNQLFIYIGSKYIRHICLFLRDHSLSLFKVLVDIVCIDYLNRVNRFEVCYIFMSIKFCSRIFLKFYVNENDRLFSLFFLYNNSNWFEREVWDMFGLFFFFNYDLRRILTDYGFKGYPLRKDFPLSGYIELKYDFELESIVYIPLKLVQEFRYFNYRLPWKRKDFIIFSGFESFDIVLFLHSIFLNSYLFFLVSGINYNINIDK